MCVPTLERARYRNPAHLHFVCLLGQSLAAMFALTAPIAAALRALEAVVDVSIPLSNL